MAPASEKERRFLDLVSGWIVSLPYDLKVLFEAKDDPNLDRPVRETAAGGIIYALSPEPNVEQDFVAFAVDAMLVREVLRTVAQKGGEGAGAFRERFSDYYASLEEDLALCRDVMGESYDWIAAKVEGLSRCVYKGKRVSQYLDENENSELLYEDGLAFQTDYPIDEENLAMRLKRPETLLEPLRRKAAEERKKIA